MFKEFKKFALKGNVLDMAIGVIIGGAFGKIVTSLVNDIIMPVFAFMTSGMSVSELAYTFPNSDARIAYGLFVQNIIDFLLISISIFAFIKLVGKLQKKTEEQPAPAEPAGPTTEELLTEIRDLLKK